MRNGAHLLRNAAFYLNGMIHKLYLGHVGIPCKISPLAEIKGNTKNISIGEDTLIQARTFLHCDRFNSISVGAGCEIQSFSRIMTYGGNIKLGDRCSVNPFTIIYGHGGVEIGSMVRIAAHVVIVSGNHGFDRMDIPIMEQETVRKRIIINDDVWIGAGAKILAGVTINRGAVIGAGSVVTHDVPENAIVVGIPARVIKFRVQSKQHKT